jgi:hypothetical protein
MFRLYGVTTYAGELVTLFSFAMLGQALCE